jgi:hypothetical protein
MMTKESILAGGEMEIITETPAPVPTPVRFPSPDRIFTRPTVVRGGAVTASDYMLATYERGVILAGP